MNGSEVWVVNKQQKSAIQATEKKVLRRIAEKRTVDRVRHVEIRDALKQEVVLEKVKRSQVIRIKLLDKMGPKGIVKKL